ncbi:MAG: hypothetical protein DBW91_01615 [Candidatus Thioglobus sp.]|nr:MAG: hypothetical protein DBW91_01615 [Candidatus Thioglobus sp.]
MSRVFCIAVSVEWFIRITDLLLSQMLDDELGRCAEGSVTEWAGDGIVVGVLPYALIEIIRFQPVGIITLHQ